ncbi:hypothetical protein NC652_008364 [Populus alba x Populus x berolinensis]|nr:hypothetical protein NC652_008364 [Populus alba x Populus x berolinensis]
MCLYCFEGLQKRLLSSRITLTTIFFACSCLLFFPLNLASIELGFCCTVRSLSFFLMLLVPTHTHMLLAIKRKHHPHVILN